MAPFSPVLVLRTHTPSAWWKGNVYHGREYNTGTARRSHLDRVCSRPTYVSLCMIRHEERLPVLYIVTSKTDFSLVETEYIKFVRVDSVFLWSLSRPS